MNPSNNIDCFKCGHAPHDGSCVNVAPVCTQCREYRDATGERVLPVCRCKLAAPQPSAKAPTMDASTRHWVECAAEEGDAEARAMLAAEQPKALTDEQILAAFPKDMGAVRVPPGWREFARNIERAILAAVQPSGHKRVTAAARDVLAERERQVTKEGWTPEHDDKHGNGDLAAAAACYSLASRWNACPPFLWPWDSEWWKQSADPRRNLEKAGALILAEIERIDRAAIAKGATK